MQKDFIRYVSISPTRITTFGRLEPKRIKYNERWESLSDEEKAKITSNKPPRFKEHTGIISKKAKKRMLNAIDWLLMLSVNKTIVQPKSKKKFRFKVSFVTLTLASKQIHSDNEIKAELLNQFFVEARKKWNVDKYVWRAEKQKNGSIHFHIIIDKFIPHYRLRAVWNRIQNKLGYVDRYSVKQKELHSRGFKFRAQFAGNWSYKKQLQAFQKGAACGWTNPNSTDVHSVTKVKNMSHYLGKYCSKNPEAKVVVIQKDRPLSPRGENGNFDFSSCKIAVVYSEKLVSGKSWGLSQSLSKMKNLVLVRDSFIDSDLSALQDWYCDSIFEGEFFVTLRADFLEWKALTFGHLSKLFENYIQSMRLAISGYKPIFA